MVMPSVYLFYAYSEDFAIWTRPEAGQGAVAEAACRAPTWSEMSSVSGQTSASQQHWQTQPFGLQEAPRMSLNRYAVALAAGSGFEEGLALLMTEQAVLARADLIRDAPCFSSESGDRNVVHGSSFECQEVEEMMCWWPARERVCED